MLNSNIQGIAIEDLLAAPFIAAANANSIMARKQTAFLMEACFELDNDDGFGEDVYHPKMITMTLSKSILLPANNIKEKPKMETVSTKFQIPLLTLIPFSSLCLKDVSVKFDMEIVSQTKGNSHEKGSTKPEETKLKGIVSYDSSEKKNDQYQKRNSSKLSVEMNAGPIPLPVGFTSILEMYTKNINPTSFSRKPSNPTE